MISVAALFKGAWLILFFFLEFLFLSSILEWATTLGNEVKYLCQTTYTYSNIIFIEVHIQSKMTVLVNLSVYYKTN